MPTGGKPPESGELAKPAWQQYLAVGVGFYEDANSMRYATLAVIVAMSVPATVLADPAMTVAPAVMRAAPSLRARPIQEVPANAQIDLNSCSGGWCYSSWRNLFGYLPVSSIEAMPYEAPPAFVPAPPIVAPPVVVAPWGWGGGPGYGYHYGYGYGWRRW
jgi:hypothetical protein